MVAKQKQPDDATHVWLPAIEQAWFYGSVFRRAYYKKVDDKWYSYTVNNIWVESSNEQEWFDEGVKLNEFVELIKEHNEVHRNEE